MKKIIDINKTYKANKLKAIDKFFAQYPQYDYWKDTFIWMAEHDVEHFVDDTYTDGTPNKDWTYSLWLDSDDDITTYIALVERENE